MLSNHCIRNVWSSPALTSTSHTSAFAYNFAGKAPYYIGSVVLLRKTILFRFDQNVFSSSRRQRMEYQWFALFLSDRAATCC